MGWYEDFRQTKDALTATLTQVSGIRSITFGEKEHIGQLVLPCLFIIPGDDTINAGEGAIDGRQHDQSWELVLLLRNPDVEKGLDEVLQLAGQCYDLLMADSSLSGTCLWSEVTSIDPGYARAETNAVIQWATIRVKTVRFAG